MSETGNWIYHQPTGYLQCVFCGLSRLEKDVSELPGEKQGHYCTDRQLCQKFLEQRFSTGGWK